MVARVAGSEDLRAHVAHGLRVDRQVAPQLLIDQLGAVEVGRVHREPVGDLIHV